ncbi:hypothetical protein [Candidatus Entotheonella palauensis]|uniref:hypothetical protein n=1 Tax=Candidatus Entotheonella palauensis TaxID=93172 RepID=UPI000B7E2AB6|nr:hypothetical protein [Candidatus Entotheonella palauensis]
MEKHSFSDFYNNLYGYEQWLSELGYTLRSGNLELPQSEVIVDAEQIASTISQLRLVVPTLNEAARRVVYIDPILTALSTAVQSTLYIEYPVSTDTLQGTVDYLLRKAGHLVVVEAKGADIERGFAQLTAELIAVAEVFTSDQPMVYGAITTGDLWYFARLHRADKKIDRDLEPYVLPSQTHRVLGALIAMIEPQD